MEGAGPRADRIVGSVPLEMYMVRLHAIHGLYIIILFSSMPDLEDSGVPSGNCLLLSFSENISILLALSQIWSATSLELKKM